MDSAGQVILVLQLVLTVGPLAVYFLGLGLASSRARPCLVSERSDFVLLALAFVPIIWWPLVSLLTSGHYALAGVLFAGTVAGFFAMLPHRGNGWVIYNISAAECEQALRRACGRLGWRMEYASPAGEDAEAIINPTGLKVVFSTLPWLRNTTLRCPVADDAGSRHRGMLLQVFVHELRSEAMLPSPTGAGLVVIGATLLGLPMWYFFHNIEAIVDVVRRMLLA